MKCLLVHVAFVMSLLLPANQEIYAKSAGVSKDFCAYYTRLDYEDRISGKYADVVVSVGQNCIDEANPRVPKSDVRMKEICFPEELPFDSLCYQC